MQLKFRAATQHERAFQEENDKLLFPKIGRYQLIGFKVVPYKADYLQGAAVLSVDGSHENEIFNDGHLFALSQAADPTESAYLSKISLAVNALTGVQTQMSNYIDLRGSDDNLHGFNFQRQADFIKVFDDEVKAIAQMESWQPSAPSVELK